jgi:hypothetical protein
MTMIDWRTPARNAPVSSVRSVRLRGLALLTLLGAAACGGEVAVDDPGVASSRAPLAVAQPRPFAAVALQNGWIRCPMAGSRSAGVFFDPGSGIVHFSGIISNGTSPLMFTLAPLYRPDHNIYVPVHLHNAAYGRVIIEPNGAVSVQADNFGDAESLTALDGVSYAPTSAGFTALTLQNGWVPAGGNSFALFGMLGGAVRFKGAIAGGSSAPAFTLPSGFRPSTNVYVPVDMCNATKGRLFIAPSGVVSVQAEDGDFVNAQCFTSLDGAWFLPDSNGVTLLGLQNGWSDGPFGTSSAGVKVVNGIAHFKGAIHGGTDSFFASLPSTFVPTGDLILPIDLCDASKGRLRIQSAGFMTVADVPSLSLANAQCFTSLDGVSYSIDGFAP